MSGIGTGAAGSTIRFLSALRRHAITSLFWQITVVTSLYAGTPLRPDRAAVWTWAVLASLLLHLGVLAVLQHLSGAVGARQSRPAVVATLRTEAGRGDAAATGVATTMPLPPADRRPAARPAASPRSRATAPALPMSAPVPAQPRRAEAEQVPPRLRQAASPEMPPGVYYFTRSELTVGALPDEAPQLPMPPGAIGEWSPAGRLVLRVLVSAQGVVERVEVASSSLPPDYQEVAVAAFARLRFRPGEIAGRAVPSEASFEIDLAADGGGSHAAGNASPTLSRHLVEASDR